jgi:hypothetical protein
LFTVPTDGDTDQLTAVLLVPVTLALRVADWPDVSVAIGGVNPIATGTSDTTALALRLETAWLVAVMTTVCADGITAGAV